MDSENRNNKETETNRAENQSNDHIPPPQTSIAHPPTGLQPPPPRAHHEPTGDKPKDWRENPKFVLKIIGLVILIAYTTFAALQWRANEKAAQAAKSAAEAAGYAIQQGIEHFRVDERAWIEIEPMKPVLLTPRDTKFGAAFKYEIYPRNMGKTVARNIVVKAQGMSSSIEFGGHAYEMNSIQDKLLLDKFKESGTTKPVRIPSNPVPKVLAPSTTASVPFTLTGQEPQIFPKSEYVSYLIGRIDYCDEFQVRHWLKFCFFVVNSRGELWNCQEGNDEDRNPETPPTTPYCSTPP